MLLYIAILPVVHALHVNICVMNQTGFTHSISTVLQSGIDSISATTNVTFSLSSTSSLNDFAFSKTTDCDIFNKTCTSLVTFADCDHAWFVDHWSAGHDIPHVMFTKAKCKLPERHGVIVLEPTASVNVVLSDIIVYDNWTNAIIFYDELVESGQIVDLINMLADHFVGTVTIRYTYPNLRESLADVQFTQYKTIVVIATEATVIDIISTAIEQQLLGPKFYWLVLSDSLTFSTLNLLLREHSNVLLVRPEGRPGGWSRCSRVRPDACQLYSQMEINKLVIEDVLHIILEAAKGVPIPEEASPSNPHCRTNDELTAARTNMTHLMKTTRYVGSAGMYEFDTEGVLETGFFELYSTSDSRQDWFANIGSWSVPGGLQLLGNHIYKNTFIDFGNETLLIGSQVSQPFIIKHVDDNNVTTFTGLCIDILDELAGTFGFKYTIVEPSDRIWGAPADDLGNWNGIVGMVMRKELTMGIGPFTITSLRETVIDFTKPYMEEGIGILTKRPDGESQKMFKTFTPFAPVVWGCIAVSIVVVGGLLYIVNRYSPYASHKRSAEHGDAAPEQMMTLKTTLWLIYGSYMEQGGDPHPNSISGRCILGFWWLFTILMASTYTANLAAFLTVTIAEKPINSLGELARQDEIKPVVKFGSNLYSLFKEAEGGVYKDIWNAIPESPVVKSNKVALKYVDGGSYAYMTDVSQLQYIMLHDCDKYSVADEIFNTAGLGFVVQENAPYLEALNYNIMKMQEAGLMDKWKRKWWPSSGKCGGSDRTSSATILGLDSLAGPFFIYAGVAGLAFVCLFLQRVFHTRKLRYMCQRLRQTFRGDAEDLEKSNVN